jgi:preprotein translocase subunit SecG
MDKVERTFSQILKYSLIVLTILFIGSIIRYAILDKERTEQTQSK